MIRRWLTALSIVVGIVGLASLVLGQGSLPIAPRSSTLFIDAVTGCRSDSANMVAVRAAAGDWSLQRTAGGAETFNFHCPLPLPFRTSLAQGARIDSFRIAHQITVAALTSATFGGLNTTTYANNTATAVATYGGTATITMPTATQALPYLTAGSLATPAFMNLSNAEVSIDWQVVMQNTGVYSVKGVAITYTLAPR